MYAWSRELNEETAARVTNRQGGRSRGTWFRRKGFINRTVDDQRPPTIIFTIVSVKAA